jgi:hypothetical protein
MDTKCSAATESSLLALPLLGASPVKPAIRKTPLIPMLQSRDLYYSQVLAGKISILTFA